MTIELDHLFVCTDSGAPEAERLIRLGFRESIPNQHPGQGTANRRFSFWNAMVELIWVTNPEEAQSEAARRTLLWERWSARHGGAAPFGICVRPADSADCAPPFPSWEYRPAYLPDPLSMHIGEAGIEEPMWVFLSFLRREQREQWFQEHLLRVREITGLTLTTPIPLRSPASQKIVESGILSARTGPEYVLEIEFDYRGRKRQLDLRPYLPVILQL